MNEEIQVHKQCLLTGKCQEDELYIKEGYGPIDICSDGCVWYVPKKKEDEKDKES